MARVIRRFCGIHHQPNARVPVPRRFKYTPSDKYKEFVLLKGTLIAASLTTLLFAGCAAPQKFDWIKEGASRHDKESALSECNYQIKLNKTAPAEQTDLLKLCMQGKGYRYKPIG